MSGVITKMRANLVPKATIATTIVLLMLRLTVGFGLFEAGKGKVHKLFGTCATNPMPECESEAKEDCGKSTDCLAKVPAKCLTERNAACKDQGQRAIEWFDTLTLAGVDSLTLPGGGKLNFTMVAFTEVIFGIFLILGLLTRLAALPLIAAMTIAMLTAHWTTFGIDLAFVGEMAFVYWVCLWVIVGLGPGNCSIDKMLAK